MNNYKIKFTDWNTRLLLVEKMFRYRKILEGGTLFWMGSVEEISCFHANFYLNIELNVQIKLNSFIFCFQVTRSKILSASQ